MHYFSEYEAEHHKLYIDKVHEISEEQMCGYKDQFVSHSQF